MAIQKEQTSIKDTLVEAVVESVETVEKVAKKRTEKIEKVAVEVKDQIIASVNDVDETKELIQEKVLTLNLTIQEQFKRLKQDLLDKLETLKGYSQQDYAELKVFIKTEFNLVIDDFSKLTKEIKVDITQLSFKHKDSLSETYQRSKQNTLDILKKVTPVKVDSNKPKLID